MTYKVFGGTLSITQSINHDVPVSSRRQLAIHISDNRLYYIYTPTMFIY